ncbi:hypothetical protein Tco_0708998 [Tanacetum coccineum]
MMWSKSQNISSEQTDRTDPPPPQAYTKHVNAVFTGSGKFDDSLANQKDPPPPIIVLGSRKVLVTSIVSLDSLYNNIWNLNKVNGPKPMKSPQGLSIAGHGEFTQQFSPSQSPHYGSIPPTQHYSTTYPSTPLAISYPSTSYPNAYSSTVHQEAYPQPPYVPQIEYIIDSGLAVPMFKHGDDPINAINKMMSFLSIVVTSRFPSTNNQLRNSSNPRQQATIHDGRVTVQPVQGRPNFLCVILRNKANTSVNRGNSSSQTRVVKCFNCQREENGKVLNKEELEFLADLGIVEAKVIPMANLSSYGSMFSPSDSNIIPYSQYLLETQNAAVQDTNSSTQQDDMILSVFEKLLNQVTNCNKVNEDNLIANETLSAELERYKERVKFLEKRQNVDLGTREKLIINDIIRDKDGQFADFEKQINSLKQTLSEQLKEKESLTKAFNVFKNESTSLEKKVKELDNIVCKMGQSAQTKPQQIRRMLYDGSVIAKETNVISIADSEETLMLEEESRSKILLKQSDPMVLENKVNIKPINYAKLNRNGPGERILNS